ncbi:MAG: C40 family peptidase [Gemmatimonadetes bacterium]|nr:C40 family peptidase [Gemmatimonadota bacterium]
MSDSRTAPHARELEALIQGVRLALVPDPRLAVFDVQPERRRGRIALVGETTEPAAAEELAARVRQLVAPLRVVDEVARLPQAALGAAGYGVVRAALAPLHAEPRLAAPQASQCLLGHALQLLCRRGDWLRARGRDGYIGWVHEGFLEVGDQEWLLAWERAEGGQAVLSLGAELVDDEARPFARLPFGARLVRDGPQRLRLPDGRRGTLVAGEVVPEDRLRDRFPPLGESVARTARRWLGAPYLWGGVTPAGTDCSGFVQSVYRMHGTPLPRDSDMQAVVGTEVEAGPDFSGLQPGDLLFFAEVQDRITHVAISLGGPHLIHAALANGGVECNDLGGDRSIEARLRQIFVRARRLLPAPSAEAPPV